MNRALVLATLAVSCAPAFDDGGSVSLAGAEIVTVDAAGRPFDRVGLRFDAAPTPRVEVAVSFDGGRSFGPRTEARLDWRERDAHNAHADVAPGATHVRLFFEHAPRFLAVELFEHTPEPTAAPGQLGTATRPLAADGVAIPRADWGARASQCSATHRFDRMTVHHTVTPNDDPDDMPLRMRQIQAFHMDTRGWCDVGYHFLVGQDGQVYQGREETLLGAHVGGANTGNAGVSFIGTFTDIAPSQAMFDAGARILQSISGAYGIAIDGDHIKGHRDYSATQCPGNTFYPRLPELIALAAGSVPATGTVRGYVFWGESPADYATYVGDASRRLSGATVTFDPGGATAVTGADGGYTIALVPGTYQVTASAAGYRDGTRPDPVTVSSGAVAWGSTMVLVEAADTTPPSIVVDSPLEGAVVDASSVTVRGTVSDDTAVVRVTVGGVPVIPTGGAFSGEVPLVPGANAIEVTAIDAAGNLATARVNVVRPGAEASGVAGFVHDAVLGESFRVAGARVRVGGTLVVTGADGAFSIEAPPGAWPMSVDAPGFAGHERLVQVLEGGKTRLTVGLVPVGGLEITFPLDGEVVSAPAITIQGGFDPPGVARVSVNGVTADVEGDTFAAEVPLGRGLNQVQAVAWDATGAIVARHAVQVRRTGGLAGCGVGTSGGAGAVWLVVLAGLFRRRRMDLHPGTIVPPCA